MKHLSIGSGAGLIFLTTLLLSVNPAEGMSPKAEAPPSELKQPYIWYDGDRDRKIWLNPNLIAEFTRHGPEQAPEIPDYPKTMVSVSKKGGVHFWRLDEGLTPEAATRSLQLSHPSSRFSPVFHENPTAKGRKRAIPGNIIVYLNPEWNKGDVYAWASGKNLQIIKKLEIAPNVFVIKSGPGMEALGLANSLYRSGEVVAAFPDWWEEFSTR